MTRVMLQIALAVLLAVLNIVWNSMLMPYRMARYLREE